MLIGIVCEEALGLINRGQWWALSCLGGLYVQSGSEEMAPNRQTVCLCTCLSVRSDHQLFIFGSRVKSNTVASELEDPCSQETCFLTHIHEQKHTHSQCAQCTQCSVLVQPLWRWKMFVVEYSICIQFSFCWLLGRKRFHSLFWLIEAF